MYSKSSTQRDARAFLWDVNEAAQAIQSFTMGLDAAGYANSPLVSSAVERKFEIIGEALNQLAKTAPELAQQIPDLPHIVDFRNQLILGYATVDHATVWSVVSESLPELCQAVEHLLRRLNAGQP